MKYQIFISGLILLLICTTTVHGQYNFDSIKICHAKKELREVVIGEYVVKMKGGQLSSLFSKDDAVNYDANYKLFTMKNLTKGTSMKLQLSNEGVIISARDTSFVLSSQKSVNLTASNGTNETLALYSIGDFSFALEFTNDRISKISLPTTGKYIVISVVLVQNVYTWDFAIESAEHLNKVSLTHVFGKPYLLSIDDDKNKVGISLLAKKKNGSFTSLKGLEIYGNNSVASNDLYKLQYTNDGRLKKRRSKFNVACEY